MKIHIRRTLMAAVAAAVALTATGCLGNDTKAAPTSSTSAGNAPLQQDSGASALKAQNGGRPLARVTNQDDLVLTVTDAQRGGGGKWLTVTGTMKNTGSEEFIYTSRWLRNPPDPKDMRLNPDSISGAILSHEATSKAYYVLRDTEGRCLCTSRIAAIMPGTTVRWTAQFPAPPKGPSQVGFQLPTFPVAAFTLGG
jgi:hypothetical protein